MTMKRRRIVVGANRFVINVVSDDDGTELVIDEENFT